MTDETKKDPCDSFWEAIEKETGSYIPPYIRNILKYHGFNSAMSIKLLDDGDLDDVELSVRSGIMDNFASKDTSTDNSKEIYGPFEAKEKFSFLRGFRKVLVAISAYIRDKGSENVGNTMKLHNTVQSSRQLFKRTVQGIIFPMYHKL